MRRVLPCVLLIGLSIVLAPAVSAPDVRASDAQGNDPASDRVLAGPYSRKQAKTGGGTPVSRNRLGGLGIEMEYLDPSARAAFLRARNPALGDPFGVRPGRPQKYSVFRVAFDNGSTTDVQFQAGNVILILDGKHPDYAVDLTDLYRVAAEAGLPDPEGAVDRVAPIVFDSSTTISQGARVERL